MSTPENARFEYPDTAGYPDGVGFLDEGTTALIDEVTADGLRDVDRPSADADAEITVRRDEHAYVAVLAGRDLASLRVNEVDGRLDVLTTTVVPEFRGRGIAAALIADALDDIRSRGLRVRVYCPVVAAFMTGNRQFTDLLDPEQPGL